LCPIEVDTVFRCWVEKHAGVSSRSLGRRDPEETVETVALVVQNETYLKMSVEELNGDLQRKTEILEREAGQIEKRLEEIEQEIGRYVKAFRQGEALDRAVRRCD
jgi:hypothetical protein